uniref:Protein AMN1 homolog n=1 Tax=Phallusia mammillata TaxID=59560 RepID=A0A6F9D6V3_9ASCI|nr:protein AMN1 homolog [Phallusia mammillata]
MAFVGGRVGSLANLSIYCVVQHLPMYGTSVQSLPLVMKNRIIYLLCKRGLLDDTNLENFLDATHKELDLSECMITDKSLLTIAKICQRLLKIDLNSPKGFRKGPTSMGIRRCGESCKLLQTVFLRRCENVDDEGIIAIAENCKFLRKLNISGCVLVGDDSLKALSTHCKQLAHINFSATFVTDHGVLCLANGECSETLKEVHMSNCKSLTDIAVECVATSCPSLEVLIFHGCPKMSTRAQSIIQEHSITRLKMKHVTWTIY